MTEILNNVEYFVSDKDVDVEEIMTVTEIYLQSIGKLRTLGMLGKTKDYNQKLKCIHNSMLELAPISTKQIFVEIPYPAPLLRDILLYDLRNNLDDKDADELYTIITDMKPKKSTENFTKEFKNIIEYSRYEREFTIDSNTIIELSPSEDIETYRNQYTN